MDINYYNTKSDETINKHIAEGWEFKFGDYISNGFKGVNSNIGLFLGYCVLMFLILMAVAFIPIAGAVVSTLFLSNCLLVGFATAQYASKKEGQMDFNNFWDGFKFIGPITTFGLLYLAGAIVFSLIFLSVLGFDFFKDFMKLQQTPYDMEASRELSAALLSKIGPLFLLGFALIVALYPVILAPFFIVFHGKSAVDSIKLSYQLMAKNYIMGFLFVFVAFFLMGLGALACGIGILYTYPASRNMLYELYADITGLENAEGSTNQITTDATTLD